MLEGALRKASTQRKEVRAITISIINPSRAAMVTVNDEAACPPGGLDGLVLGALPNFRADIVNGIRPTCCRREQLAGKGKGSAEETLLLLKRWR